MVLITSFSLPFCVVHSISSGLVSLPDGLDGFLRRALRRILGVSRDQLQFGCLRCDPPQPVQCSGPVARQNLLGFALDVMFFGDIEQFLDLVLAKNPIAELLEMPDCIEVDTLGGDIHECSWKEVSPKPFGSDSHLLHLPSLIAHSGCHIHALPVTGTTCQHVI